MRCCVCVCVRHRHAAFTIRVQKKKIINRPEWKWCWSTVDGGSRFIIKHSSFRFIAHGGPMASTLHTATPPHSTHAHTTKRSAFFPIFFLSTFLLLRLEMFAFSVGQPFLITDRSSSNITFVYNTLQFIYTSDANNAYKTMSQFESFSEIV